MSRRIADGGVTVEKVFDRATAGKVANRDLTAVLQPQLLDERAVDPIKIPDESQHARQISNAVTAVRIQHARERPPGAEMTRTLEPRDQRRAWQPEIEGGGGEISIADPGLARMRRADQCTKGGHVALPPIRLPDVVEADDRNAEPFSEASRESGFAGTRRSQKDNSQPSMPQERADKIARACRRGQRRHHRHLWL